jgi:hypothetical protein
MDCEFEFLDIHMSEKRTILAIIVMISNGIYIY